MAKKQLQFKILMHTLLFCEVNSTMNTKISLKKQLRSLTLPIFVETLLIMFLGFMDILMLSKVSDNAVAAVGLANQILLLVNMVFMLGVLGATVVCSQYIGAKNEHAFVQTTGVALTYNFIVGICFGIFFIFYTPFLLDLLKVKIELVANASIYFKIVGGLSVLMCLNLTLSAILRSCNLANYPMYVSVVVNITNIIGNYALIFGKFGLPELGVQGAAISTACSRCIACALLFYALKKQKIKTSILKNLFPFPFDKLQQIFKIGMPAAGEMVSYSLSQTLIVYFVNKLGNDVLAARTYLVNIIMFIFLFALALGQGSAILVGQLIGREKRDTALKLGRLSLKVAISVSFMLSLFLALVAPWIMPLMTKNQDIISLCLTIFWVDILLEIGRAVNILGGRMLGAVSNPEFPFVVGVIFMWGIATLGSYILGIWFGYGLVGMWICFLLDECIRGIFIWKYWESGKWASRRLITN